MKAPYLTAIILLIGIPVIVQAQLPYKRSGLNPEYLKYIQEKEPGEFDRYTPQGYRLNYIPNPVKLNFRSRDIQGALKSSAAFPGRFDLRDSSLVTPAKNQGGGEFGGNCVAFATMGSLESNWLKMGDKTYDLSEQNQAACYGFEWAYGDGATQHMPCAYLSRFSGPVLESQDPYNLDIQECNSSFDPVYYVPEVRWLPKDEDLIKRIIMNYGAIVVSVHILYDRYNEDDYTYYYDGDEPANHAFLLCGWDDEKETEGGTGAWIIKNSWGESWGDNGYVYVSYNDTKVLDDITFYPYRWDTDEVDHLYYYDELGAIYTIGWATTATTYDHANGLIKFRTSANQLIDRIGTYVLSEGTILDFEAYTGFDGKNLSGLITSRENIYVEYPGYYTFSLPFEVSGDFYIKVSYNTPGFDTPIPVEGYQQADDEEWADPVLENNVCWYGIDDTSWILLDTLAEPANLCIRAYGRNLNKISARVVADKPVSCLNSDVTFTAVTTGDPTGFAWDFGSGAEPATASTEGPHMVSYSTTGTKHVRLVVTGTGGSDTTIRYNAVEIVDQIKLNVERDTVETPSRFDVELKAYGADTYSWEPADYLNTTEGNIVTLHPDTTGTLAYTVTGTQGSCTAEKTITVISNPRPLNDDVCEAMFIQPVGFVGTFSNLNATVQLNEPAPETGPGGCTTNGMWCIEAEGKLQNSIWFWFLGPETNMVSIDTRGLDNQIAIYRADSCTDILAGEYFLVQAYDDYYGVDTNYAAAIEMALTYQDQKYFIQVDGSGGGQAGDFDLYLRKWPLGLDELSTGGYDRVLVYPNPNEGRFTLLVTNTPGPRLEVEIFNTAGQLISRDSWYRQGSESSHEFDLGDQPAGIYHIRIMTEDSVYFRRLIKR